MARPLTAEINLNALKHNAAAAKTRCLGARLFGVVKADAYGHGLQRVIPALNGLDGFSVIEIESASFIRDQGDLRRILLLEGVFDSAELQEASVRQFDLVVHAVEQSQMLVAAKLSKPLNIFLKVNTGMNRLGISLGLVEEQLATLRSSRNVRDIVLMTHFADADGESGVSWQADLIKEIAKKHSLPLSCSNSASLILFGGDNEAWVRPGIMLYGASPINGVSAESLNLKPAMTLRSEIIGIQNLEKGDTVGYGRTYRATERQRIAIVAGGYGDGYPRSAPTGTPVLVDGVRSKLIGRVSMDTLQVDITHIDHAKIGTKVVLWGDGLPVEEVATSAGTISYELLTRVNRRVRFNLC